MKRNNVKSQETSSQSNEDRSQERIQRQTAPFYLEQWNEEETICGEVQHDLHESTHEMNCYKI